MTDRHRTATSDYSGCYLDAQFVTTCIVLCGHLIGTAVRARYIQLWRKATAVEMVGRRGGGEEREEGGREEQVSSGWLPVKSRTALCMAQQDRPTVTGFEFPCPLHISLKGQTGFGMSSSALT